MSSKDDLLITVLILFYCDLKNYNKLIVEESLVKNLEIIVNNIIVIIIITTVTIIEPKFILIIMAIDFIIFKFIIIV